MRTSWRPDRAGVLAASMLALALLAGADSPPSPVGSKAGEARVRRPVALALAPGGARLYVANRRGGSVSVIDPEAGRVVAECHAPPSYTSEGTFDVGLLDEAGHREFNPPSLLGVGDRPPYLHDGRAASLPEVFLRHRHPRDATWTPEEVEALTAFLRTL